MLDCQPVNDEKAHVVGAGCWCEPDVCWLDPETGLPWANPHANPYVIHHAADMRELVEQLEPGVSVADGKHWVVTTWGEEDDPC